MNNYIWIAKESLAKANEILSKLDINEKERIEDQYTNNWDSLYESFMILLDYDGAPKQRLDYFSSDLTRFPKNIPELLKELSVLVDEYVSRREYEHNEDKRFGSLEMGQRIKYSILSLISIHDFSRFHIFGITFDEECVSISFAARGSKAINRKNLFDLAKETGDFAYLSALLPEYCNLSTEGGQFNMTDVAFITGDYSQSFILITGSSNKKTAKTFIRYALKEKKLMTRAELSTATGFTDRVIAYALSQMLEKGEIEYVGDKHSPKNAYKLRDDNKE